MQICKMVLSHEVCKTTDSVTIATPGTSCQHHIKDGTGKTAIHPIKVMYEAVLLE